MPTYVYKDPVTGETREVFHGMNQSPEIVNESTGNRMERVISGGAGFLFKGDGFYATENRSSSYKSAEKSESSSSHSCSGPACCGGGSCAA
ncbi:MAG: FmdB family transcriptional regulator [Fibrobacterota bacterium]|nr:FmdB family transcriptional regulator [Fibrobacterota bacterium]QQS07469.1 MAG: FmdB family transcriptional regulator [Fibrobacterota bacterium]